MAKCTFELWDLETGNMVDAFATEAEALGAVRDAYERHGECYVLSWALARATHRRMESLGEGEALIERALARATDAQTGSPAAD